MRPAAAAVLAVLMAVPLLLWTPAASASAPAAPFLTAAAVNSTEITASWTAPAGAVTNYTLSYARFYGVQIAYVNVANRTVYNLTGLGSGLTYYLTVRAWDNASEGPPSNVAPAHTDPAPPSPPPPFPWSTLTAITTLSILGSMAVSFAIAGYVGRRTRGAAAIAIARSRGVGPRYPAGRAPPPASRSYSAASRPGKR